MIVIIKITYVRLYFWIVKTTLKYMLYFVYYVLINMEDFIKKYELYNNLNNPINYTQNKNLHTNFIFVCKKISL
jgi:hypothetical protein